MKILTLGDVHGRDRWAFHTHGSTYEFNHWRTMVENGVPADDKEFWKEMPYSEYDKIVFVGDYVDSFDLSNVIILDNLKNILFFKQALPDKVVLLLGNHDIQYFIPNEVCSGYRAEMRPDLYNLFNDNKECFKAAHLEEDKDGKKYLWTHAGLTKGWHTEVLRDVNSPNYRLTDFFIGSHSWKIDKFLNLLLELRVDNLFNVDAHSGGANLWAGPFWVRPSVFNDHHLEGYNQIVGHTPHKTIRIDKCGDDNHYFVDCLFEDCDDVLILDL
jgi:hypothetical protein